MKAWEICKKENLGKRYIDDEGVEWKIYKVNYSGYDMYNNDNFAYLSNSRYINEINDMNFKEAIDWSKVPVDTKILVKNDECGKWKRRYFAAYKNGILYTWDFGTTSFSNEGNNKIHWNYAKLYDENEDK